MDQEFLRTGLAELKQVKTHCQTVRTWSNTHRAGAPLSTAPPASQTAGSAARQGIDIASAPVTSRYAQQHESAVDEERMKAFLRAAGPGQVQARGLTGERAPSPLNATIIVVVNFIP
jgi:hypothetical protein